MRISDEQFQEQLAAHRLRRDALIARIYEEFRGVTREGGRSWSEASARDDYKNSPEEIAEARAKDTETSWEELVDSEMFWPEILHGGFNFLDAIGFRYYFAPAMIRGLRSSDNILKSILDPWDLDEDAFKRLGVRTWRWTWRFPFVRTHDEWLRDRRQRQKERFQLFTAEQIECIAEYTAIFDESDTWGYWRYLSDLHP